MKKYVQTLQQRLQWAYEVAQEHIEKEVGRRKLYYDRKVHCMDIIPGDIVLVWQKVFRTQHKIEDRWELPVYKVLEQCGDSPLYKVQKIGGVRSEDPRVLHRNMLYPQCKGDRCTQGRGRHRWRYRDHSCLHGAQRTGPRFWCCGGFQDFQEGSR